MDSQNENNEIGNVDTFHNLGIKKRELEEIVGYRTRGSILKPDAGGVNEGEKNTKYFFLI